MFFHDALDGYWLEKNLHFSPRTKLDYTLTFTRFDAYISGHKTHVHEITSDQIRKFLAYTQKKYKLGQKTLSNHWIALSSFFTWAGNEPSLATPHPMHGIVERPRFERPAIEIYTKVEITAMLQACATAATWNPSSGTTTASARPEILVLRDRAIIITLLDCGIRAQELCDLIMKDYDAKKGRLLVRHGKGNKQRLLPLGQAAQKAIWRYHTLRPGASPLEPLFSTRNTTHLAADNLGNMIETTAARAGVARCGVHRFRHTFAVNYLRNGGNVVGLQAMLGHKKMETITIYARLAETDIEAAQQIASPADRMGLG